MSRGWSIWRRGSPTGSGSSESPICRSDAVEPANAPAVGIVAAAVEPLTVVLHDPDGTEALGTERCRPGEDRTLAQKLGHEGGSGGLGIVVVVGAVDDEEPLPGPRHGHIEHPALLRHRDALVPSLEEVRELVGHRVGEPSAIPVGYHEDVVRLQTLGRVGGKEPDRPYVNPVILVILPSAVDHVHRSGLTRHTECELAVPVPEGVDVRSGPPYDEHGLR